MSEDTPRDTAPEREKRGKGDSEGHFRNFPREEQSIRESCGNRVENPLFPSSSGYTSAVTREKPFMVRVLRFDPKSRRGDAPVKYLLPLWDDEQVDRFTKARSDETFILRDDLHGVDLLCVRQGPLSGGVGARLACVGETD